MSGNALIRAARPVMLGLAGAAWAKSYWITGDGAELIAASIFLSSALLVIDVRGASE